MKRLIILSGLLLLTTLLFCQTQSTKQENKITVVKNGSSGYGEKLKERLDYLNKVKEIIWIDIENNDVYIGFDPVPDDWKLVAQMAALHGNNKIGFGVHVWAIHTRQRGWRPGTGGYLGEYTARYGSIEK